MKKINNNNNILMEELNNPTKIFEKNINRQINILKSYLKDNKKSKQFVIAMSNDYSERLKKTFLIKDLNDLYKIVFNGKRTQNLWMFKDKNSQKFYNVLEENFQQITKKNNLLGEIDNFISLSIRFIKTLMETFLKGNNIDTSQVDSFKNTFIDTHKTEQMNEFINDFYNYMFKITYHKNIEDSEGKKSTVAVIKASFNDFFNDLITSKVETVKNIDYNNDLNITSIAMSYYEFWFNQPKEKSLKIQESLIEIKSVNERIYILSLFKFLDNLINSIEKKSQIIRKDLELNEKVIASSKFYQYSGKKGYIDYSIKLNSIIKKIKDYNVDFFKISLVPEDISFVNKINQNKLNRKETQEVFEILSNIGDIKIETNFKSKFFEFREDLFTYNARDLKDCLDYIYFEKEDLSKISGKFKFMLIQLNYNYKLAKLVYENIYEGFLKNQTRSLQSHTINSTLYIDSKTFIPYRTITNWPTIIDRDLLDNRLSVYSSKIVERY